VRRRVSYTISLTINFIHDPAYSRSAEMKGLAFPMIATWGLQENEDYKELLPVLIRINKLLVT
jgi:hypothetical protein